MINILVGFVDISFDLCLVVNKEPQIIAERLTVICLCR